MGTEGSCPYPTQRSLFYPAGVVGPGEVCRAALVFRQLRDKRQPGEALCTVGLCL